MELTEQKKELIAQFEEWLNEVGHKNSVKYIKVTPKTKIPYICSYGDIDYYRYTIGYDSEGCWWWNDSNAYASRSIEKKTIKKWFRDFVSVVDCDIELC